MRERVERGRGEGWVRKEGGERWVKRGRDEREGGEG